MAMGSTIEDFVADLAIAIEDYVHVYLADFANMVSTPGTKEQALIILSLQDKEIDEIRGLVNGTMDRTEEVLSK